MRNVVLALVAVGLSLCFGLPLQRANSARIAQAGADEKMTTDIADSEEFFQAAIRSAGPGRDYTKKNRRPSQAHDT